MKHKAKKEIMMRKVTKLIKAVLFTTVLCASVLFMGDVAHVHAEGTAKVAADGAKIRSEASTSGDVVASVTKGDKLDVLASTKASDGYTWYKIRVNGTGQGYVRADLVSDVEGSISTEDSSSSTAPASDNADSSESEAVSTEVSASSVVSARITGDSVTVRSGASTKTDKKATATGGIEVNVTGEASDAEGNTWYQVNYSYDDKTVEGYIRSDFLEVLSTTDDEAQEGVDDVEPIAEEPQVEVNQDFEVKYETNNDGVDEWFLYDHIRGTKQSINNIYAVMQQSQEMSESSGGASTGVKVALILMAVVILGLVIALTIMVFKLRDSYDDMDDFDEGYSNRGYDREPEVEDEESYEDEEEDDDDDDDYYSPRKRRPAKKKLFGGGRRKRYDEYDDDDDDDDYNYEDEDEEDDEEEYVRPSSRRSTASTNKRDAWPSRGMIDVDDDMEFEFLDLED